MTRTTIINLLFGISLSVLAVGCSHSAASGAGIGTIVLAIHPPAVTIAPGQIIPFAASVTGTSDTTVTWSVLEGAAGGQVSGQGVYTAPAGAGTYHVVATSHADVSRTATAVVTVTGTTAVAIDGGGGGGGTADGATTVSATHVTRDPNGWTVVTPSVDTRIIYVSSSQGNDANNGLSDATPLKTLAKAVKLLRSGYPDWLLLKAGDVWVGGFGTFEDFGGRSTDEPMLFSSYGSGARPQIQPAATDGTLFAKQGNNVCPHVYLIGLDFYDPRLDPNSSSFQKGVTSATGFGWLDGGDDILVEDCYFRFLNGGLNIQLVSTAIPAPQNVVLRRNVVTDMYAFSGLTQGFFFYKVTNLLVEESIFDHNAWNDQAGVPADVFNHHMYIDEVNNMILRNNLLLRASSLSVKFRSDDKDGSIGALVQNNFFFESEVGIAVAYGGTSVPSDGTCFSNYQIQDNVMVQVNRDNPTQRGLGWGMEIKTTSNSVISGNIFTDFSFTGNSLAIALDGDNDNYVSTGITVENNLAYRIHDQALEIDPLPNWSNIKIQNNTIQDPDLGAAMITLRGPFTSLTFSGDTYSLAPSAAPTAFANVYYPPPGAHITYDQWVAQSGETGSQLQTNTYPDPGRNLDTYVTTINPNWTLDDFYTAVRTQSKQSWHPEYTAAVVNDYIRAGFGLPAFTASP